MDNIHAGEIGVQRSEEDMERGKEMTAKSFFNEAEQELGNKCSVERKGEVIIIRREHDR